MIDTTVEKMGKVFACCELGGAGMSTPETIGVTETGSQDAHHDHLAHDQPGRHKEAHEPDGGGQSHVGCCRRIHPKGKEIHTEHRHHNGATTNAKQASE